MIKRQLLTTVSCLALSGAASAADLPARVMPVKAPAPVVVTSIWAGPYIGINGGAVWNRLTTDTNLIAAPYDSQTVTATGATFGGQIGYNWQSQNFVFGLEADANWVGAKKTLYKVLPNTIDVTYTAKLSWLATVRGRAGVLLAPRTLVFATGGLAVGGVESSWDFVPACCDVTSDKTRVGWTAGGGIEHFITNPHVTVKAEALYVDLGRSTVSGAGFNNNYTSRFKNTAVLGRLGLNLKW